MLSKEVFLARLGILFCDFEIITVSFTCKLQNEMTEDSMSEWVPSIQG